MAALRLCLLRNRALAAGLVLAALLMKVLVPTGYMVSASAGSITIEVCSGYGPQRMVMVMPGMGHRPDQKNDPGRAEMPCAFTGLSVSSLTGADPLVLAIAIAFMIFTAFRIPMRPATPSGPAYLRPPLRGPPTRG